MSHDCPICGTETDNAIASTPYFECPTCFLWFQDPMPPKLYQAPTEYDLEEMPERDRQVNRDLARLLFDTVMKGRKAQDDEGDFTSYGMTLDIGAKHPVLAQALHELTHSRADAIDGVAPTPMDGVKTWAADFETMPIKVDRDKYALITMIHTFEHMYDPVRALSRLRLLVEDDGRVFLRIPDHRCPGFERDLTAHHYSIHPYFHCLTSILEALATVNNAFVIERTYDMPGAGQRDIILRPIGKAPTLAVAMIAKNEERDIGRAIKSFGSISHGFALVDTGSKDRTLSEACEAWRDHKRFYSQGYTGASERDESGDWKLWNFSKARNVALQAAECMGDWVAWFDADDELILQNALRRAMYWPEWDAFGMWINSGGTKWIQYRMWKASKHVRFKGRCHEYAVLDGLKLCTIDEGSRPQDDGAIRHHAEPGANQENSNPRNLRILLREWEEDGPTTRTAFYIAETYSDAGKAAEAAEWYARRIAMPDGFVDETGFARLKLARALRTLGQHDKADAQTMAAILLYPDWMEFRMELAHGRYSAGKYQEAIDAALQVPRNCTIPQTVLWREVGAYRDQPARLISWCYEHLGDIPAAIEWSDRAAHLIGRPDQDWAIRHRRLVAMREAADQPPPAIVKRLRRQIALHRPGAIGDILMTLNLIPALRAANPDADIHYFCGAGLGAPDALGGLMLAAGVDLVMDSAGLPAWRKSYDRVIDLIGYPLAEGYPERRMRLHLLEYFAAEMGVGPMQTVVREKPESWERPQFVSRSTHDPYMPALTLRRPHWAPDFDPPSKSVAGGYATLQCHAGWSDYKAWPIERWQQVVAALPFPVILLYERDKPWVAGCFSGMGSLAQSIAIFANARMHLGIDSFTNHLTNYFWTDETGGRRVPGVILWGSTQYTASGYEHNTNISKGLECQPCFRETAEWSRMKREPCINQVVEVGRQLVNVPPDTWKAVKTHRCMAEITVDEVVAAALELWERAK